MAHSLSILILLIGLSRLFASWNAVFSEIDQEIDHRQQSLAREYDLRLCLSVTAGRQNFLAAGQWLHQENLISTDAQLVREHRAQAIDDAVATAITGWEAHFICETNTRETNTNDIENQPNLSGKIYREHSPPQPDTWPNWRYRLSSTP